jgi:hypothetical protein
MATNPAGDIKTLYDDSIRETHRIIGSAKSTDEQADAALDSFRHLTSLLLEQTLNTVAGRTALLAGLITELNKVTSAVEVNPPYLDAAKSFTTLTTRATALLEAEKKKDA